MKKFDGILFASDLDGTLLRKDKSVSTENLRAIEYFKSEGGVFTFVTGRIPPATRHIFDVVETNAPCGCANGGCIYDYRSDKLLWTMDISPSVMELVEYVEENIPSVGIEICMFDKIYFYRKNSSTETHRLNEKLPDLSCRYSDIKEPVSKILFADEDEKMLDILAEKLKRHPAAKNFDFIRSDKEYYEILPKGVSKGLLVEKIAEIMGIDMKRCIAIGDNENDISMIKRAGLGIAVSNATETLKASADLVTVSNEENAVAKVIEMLDMGTINL